MDPFDWPLKQALEAATQGILRDLVEGALPAASSVNYNRHLQTRCVGTARCLLKPEPLDKRQTETQASRPAVFCGLRLCVLQVQSLAPAPAPSQCPVCTMAQYLQASAGTSMGAALTALHLMLCNAAECGVRRQGARDAGAAGDGADAAHHHAPALRAAAQDPHR